MKKVTLAAALLISAGAASQNFHLSQYDASVQYLNPALTGIYFKEKTDYRINANFRQQWKALASKPYTTFSAAYDMKYDDKFGVGGFLINNRSGAGNLNTLTFLGSGSYRIADDQNGPHNLTVGIQMGLFYKSFDPNGFTYDNQYSASQDGFDVSIPSGETFGKTGIVRFEASMGVFYKYIEQSKDAMPFIGFSVYHLPKPNESFTDQKSRMPMHFIVHGGSDFKINDNLKLVPTVLYMNQARAYDLNMGLSGWYRIKDTDAEVMLGVNYRWKDALIVQVGYKQDQHIFRISYDINTSYLNAFSGGRGGLEFSLVLCGKKGEPLFKPVSRIN
ncbi:MAG: PorP/SprF family type IX secretion system membrane protein [Bacteroidota bacterium]